MKAWMNSCLLVQSSAVFVPRVAVTYTSSLALNTSRVLLALLIPWGQIVSLGARLSLLGLCETTL